MGKTVKKSTQGGGKNRSHMHGGKVKGAQEMAKLMHTKPSRLKRKG